MHQCFGRVDPSRSEVDLGLIQYLVVAFAQGIIQIFKQRELRGDSLTLPFA